MLHEGDKFTVEGMKQLDDGNVVFDCAPGDESVFTAGAPIPKIGQVNFMRIFCQPAPKVQIESNS